MSGPNNSYIATLVERHTRYVMLAKVAGKDTRTVVCTENLNPDVVMVKPAEDRV